MPKACPFRGTSDVETKPAYIHYHSTPMQLATQPIPYHTLLSSKDRILHGSHVRDSSVSPSNISRTHTPRQCYLLAFAKGQSIPTAGTQYTEYTTPKHHSYCRTTRAMNPIHPPMGPHQIKHMVKCTISSRGTPIGSTIPPCITTQMSGQGPY